jgi:hypothetical protein
VSAGALRARGLDPTGCAALSEKTETVTARAGLASDPLGPDVRKAPRRRPTGVPPPLPHPVSVTTRAWLVLAVVVLAAVILVSVRVVAAAR